MSMAEAIRSAAAAVSHVVAGISPDQLDNPTPCSEYDVRALGNHLTGFLPYSANAARKGPDLEGEAPDFTDGDWAATFSALAADLGAAWAEDGAMEGDTKFGRSMMPAQNAAGVTLMELAVHGWDLAVATGQQIVMDPQTAALAAIVTTEAGNQGREFGFFGPEVPAPDNATDFEKALAVSGRTVDRDSQAS